MFCKQCGKEIPDDSVVCPQCGANLQEPAPAPAAPQEQYRPVQPTNTLCVVGFVLSLFFAFIGLIVSIVAFNQVKKTGEGGKGLAIAGIVIGAIEVVLYIILVAAYCSIIMASVS